MERKYRYTGTPFNLHSSGASENQTTEEFASDLQVETYDEVMEVVNSLENRAASDSNFDSMDSADRDRLDTGSWSRVDQPGSSDEG